MALIDVLPDWEPVVCSVQIPYKPCKLHVYWSFQCRPRAPVK